MSFNYKEARKLIEKNNKIKKWKEIEKYRIELLSKIELWHQKIEKNDSYFYKNEIKKETLKIKKELKVKNKIKFTEIKEQDLHNKYLNSINKSVSISKEENEILIIVEKFINLINCDEIIEFIEENEHKNYSDTFYNLLEIIKKYKQIEENLKKTYNLQIIFKELYSLIDKIYLEKCWSHSFKTLKLKDNLIDEHPLNFLFTDFLPNTVNKWNLVFLKYSDKNKILIIKQKNTFFNKLQYCNLWMNSEYMRNIFEHSWSNRFVSKGLKNIFNSEEPEIIYLKILILFLTAINIYIIYNDNIFIENNL